jgi:hypothetical protein
MGWGSGVRGLTTLGALVAWGLVGTGLASSSGAASHFMKLTRGGHSPTAARELAVAATLLSGEVLIAGGDSSRLNPVSSAELFNPTTDTFKQLTGAGKSLSQARRGAVAVTLRSGDVLIAGGSHEKSAELFNPATDTFTKLTGRRRSPTEGRFGAIAATLPSGQVLIAGGFSGRHVVSSAELFDPTRDKFTKLTGAGQSMVEARDGAIAAKLPNGDVLIAGGLANRGGGTPSTAELFNPASDTFTKLLTGPEQSLTEAREWAAAAALPDGQVLIAGGQPGTCRSDCVQTSVSTAELFNPATDTFTKLTGAGQSLTERREGAIAAVLRDGHVLIAGGMSSARPRSDYAASSAELFNPATDTFTKLAGSG